MTKQFLSFGDLEDLVRESKEDVSGKNICVQVEADFSIDAEQDKYKEELVPFRCKAYHDLNNANGSRIEPDVFIDNTKSIEGRPVLANIVETEDGELDFGSHDFHFEEDEEGNLKRVYEEKPIGVVTNYGFMDDPVQGCTRAVVCGYLFARYSPDSVEILERRKTCSCSVELVINEAHYDMDLARMVLDDYFVSGVTILGKRHQPGMAGSEISLEDFSKENNSVVYEVYKHLTQEELTRVQGDWVRDFLVSEKGGEEMEENKVEETVEEVADTEVPAEEVSQAEEAVEETVEEAGPKTYSVTLAVNGKDVAVHSLTLDDKMHAVYDSLFTWSASHSMDVSEVFAYESEVVFRNYADMKWYKLTYSWENDTPVFADNALEGSMVFKTNEQILTEAESMQNLQNENVSLKSMVSTLQEELNSYKAKELSDAKDAVLADPVFESCLETEEFKEVVKKKDELSLEDFKLQTELAFAKCQRRVVNANKDSSVKAFAVTKKSETKKSRYGNIFEK